MDGQWRSYGGNVKGGYFEGTSGNRAVKGRQRQTIGELLAFVKVLERASCKPQIGDDPLADIGAETDARWQKETGRLFFSRSVGGNILEGMT
jgi:hypothetical protein